MNRIMKIWLPSLAALGVAVAAAPAMGQTERTLCVRCSEPERTYKCTVRLPAGIRPGRSLKLLCVYQLAKDGGHASCSVRSGGGESCTGEPVILSYSPGATEAEAGAGAVAVAPGSGAPPAAAPSTVGSAASSDASGSRAPGTGEPKTVVEWGDRVVKSSRKRIESVGDSVTGAAKRTGETVRGAAGKVGDRVRKAARSAGTSVRDAARKTDRTVRRAAKSTWTCITSLFRSCN